MRLRETLGRKPCVDRDRDGSDVSRRWRTPRIVGTTSNYERDLEQTLLQSLQKEPTLLTL